MGGLASKRAPLEVEIPEESQFFSVNDVNPRTSTDYTAFKKNNDRYYEGLPVQRNKEGRYIIVNGKKKYLPIGASTTSYLDATDRSHW